MYGQAASLLEQVSINAPRRAWLAALTLAVSLPACGAEDSGGFHDFRSLAVSADGKHVASIEAQEDGTDRDVPATLWIRDLDGAAAAVKLSCMPGPNCSVSSPTWSSDGRLSFLLTRSTDGVTAIETLDPGASVPHRVLEFDGPLDALRYGPDDRLAVLATANAHKNVGRTEAGAPLLGAIDGDGPDEQRIAVVAGGNLEFVSPPDLYVYEYDFLPNGGFVATAAPGDGDSQWWIAKLYVFDAAGARVVFAPAPREQLASPSAAPDGKSVAFIGGWMSDFGSTGGDAFVLRLDTPGAAPKNLTRDSRATVTALDWHCGGGLTGLLLRADQVSLVRLDAPADKPLWTGPESLAGGDGGGISCAAHGAAAVLSSFTAAPEIVAGPLGAWHAITHENAGITVPLTAQSVKWRNDGLEVQGWLLQPRSHDPRTAPLPMIVLVHGGPEAAARNRYVPATATTRALLSAGWAVFEPNYRGSFGQGERFAAASIRDLGGGDWRDVYSGIDAAERAAPIDDSRLGIMGSSYGGYMAMWAVTQTHRFRAAVANAGVSDWLSLEGEAPQAGSDEVNFGGSVYDDAAPYLRASPIMHMRGVTTPTLITVGERDLECPMPQSQEFYTALRALAVPAEFYVYPGEGHGYQKAENRVDFRRRAVRWFQRWFATGQ